MKFSRFTIVCVLLSFFTNLSFAEGDWSIPERTVPLPAGISQELRDSLKNGPVPDIQARQNFPKDEAGWLRLKAQRDAMFSADIPDFLTLMKVDAEKEKIAGVSVTKLMPAKLNEPNKNRLFIYLHGGAYVYRSGDAGLSEAIVIANRLGIPVLSIDYAMPPLHPFPAAVDDVIAVYKRLVEQYSPGALIIGGTSAGGGLALASVHKMRQLELPVPAAVYGGTPWADLSKTGDTIYTNESLDRILVTYDGSLGAAAKLYASGHDLKDPLISPVYGEFHDYPPVFLVSGTRDLFLSDVVRTHRKLRAAGVDADLHVYEGMSHADYIAVMNSPESLDMYRELADFVDMHLSPAESHNDANETN